MTVSGVAPPSTAALAASQSATQSATQSVQTDGAQHASQVKHFDGLMQPPAQTTATTAALPPQATQTAQATQANQTTQPVTPTSSDVRMTPVDANHSSLVDRLRNFTSDLDTRYSNLQKHQTEMLSSMTQNANDPLMSMAQAMDFQWSATTTISEYQLSLAVAQATNGLTHSILKNQE
ncbi:hypothetical protein [Paraburkholderia flava]|uniref:hypothetical protein n=1 Tax=Paraburkholderia flava TaxID=2547393 RepID=UPI00105F16C8|nr:hypothetical protein [Paraburkholderia flava]